MAVAKWETDRTPIMSWEVADYLRAYGHEKDTFLYLYNKLQRDLNHRNQDRRTKTSTEALARFLDNLRFFDNNIDNLLDYLCIMAKMEEGSRESIIKFQFYHLFKIKLKIK